MEKHIYMTIETRPSGDTFEGKPTYDRDEAIRESRYWWDHLTERERLSGREVYVGVFTVDVNEGESAQDVYNWMLLEGTWPNDHDMIRTCVDCTGIDADTMESMVADYLADHYDEDDPLELDGKPYIDEETEIFTQNAHDSEHEYTLVNNGFGDIRIIG